MPRSRRRVKKKQMSDDERKERLAKYRSRFAARGGEGEAPVRAGFRTRAGKGSRRANRGQVVSSYAKAHGGKKPVPPGQVAKQNLLASVSPAKANPRVPKGAYKRRLRQNTDLPFNRGRGRR